MRKTFILLVAMIIVGNLSSIEAAEKASPVFDERPWELGWSQNEGEAVFEEYVLVGENVQSWSELVSIQFFPGLQNNVNPDIYEARVKLDLSTVCPDLQWSSVYQKDDERMWSWSISNCQGQPAQSEIALLKRTDEGFHVWHYAIKKSPMPSDVAQQWKENLQAIVIEEKD